MWPCFHCKETPQPDAAELPLQEDRDEGEEKEEKREEQTVEHKEADGSIQPAGDWLKEQEEESSDWPRERVCHTHERAIPIQQTVEALDITEEGEWKHSQGYVHE